MDFFDDVIGWEEIKYFDKAYAIAKDAHKDQKRDEGTPYITHIEGVLDILKNELKIRNDIFLAVAALHDVLEDSPKYSFDSLKKMFDEDTAKAVDLLTKKEGQKVQDYLNDIDISEYSSWLMLIKLSDRLNNVRSLKLIQDQTKINKYVKETQDHYLAYANKYNQYLYSEITKALGELNTTI